MLVINDLHVYYQDASPEHPVRALDGISLTLQDGETLGIVGETGSGKSTLALTLMGLVSGARISGEVLYRDFPLPIRDELAMRSFRWREIALAFQGAGSAFDPVYTIGQQIIEPMLAHLEMDKEDASRRAYELMELVGLPAMRFDHYPHQLSGGEKKRAMIAMALSCNPRLLILDEPTTGLDTLTRQALSEMLVRLQREHSLAMIVISHDLTDIARLAGRTAVFYAGRLVELGQTQELLEEPCHPYTWGLVNAYPLMTRTKDLWGIRGSLPDPANPPEGCRFHPRCTQAVERCRQEVPELQRLKAAFPSLDRQVACHLGGLLTLLRVNGLSKTYWNGSRSGIRAVKNASLEIREGEVVGLVGQSGSGKTTLARLIVGLDTPDDGRVEFEGQDLSGDFASRNGARRRIQLIFQDPFEALSPQMNVLELVREPLDIQAIGSRQERNERLIEALRAVNLPASPDFLHRFTYELSGGQLQRIAIARALVLEPKLIVADEPVSMLDASEQAKVLRLLKRVQNERGMALLLISHDIALVRKVADRIAVMHAGEIVEQGPSPRVLHAPQHAYTRSLIEASQAGALDAREVMKTGEGF